jgi:hypothetical protein
MMETISNTSQHSPLYPPHRPPTTKSDNNYHTHHYQYHTDDTYYQLPTPNTAPLT